MIWKQFGLHVYQTISGNKLRLFCYLTIDIPVDHVISYDGITVPWVSISYFFKNKITNTVWCHYTAVDSLHNSHNTPTARPRGQDMRCISEVYDWFMLTHGHRSADYITVRNAIVLKRHSARYGVFRTMILTTIILDVSLDCWLCIPITR